MTFEEPKQESVSPEELLRQQEAKQMCEYIQTKLGELNALNRPPSEQIEMLISFLQEVDKDKPITIEEKNLHGLLSDLRAFKTGQVPSYAADLISAMMAKEGKYSNKRKYQEKIMSRNLTRHGFKTFPDNFVFSYGIDKDYAHIHLANPYATSDKMGAGSGLAVLREFISGLVQFAHEVVEKDESIKVVSATSKLLAKPEMAKCLESLGFVNKGVISDEKHKAHFHTETEPVIELVADRESFLTKIKNMDARMLQRQMIKLIRELK